jgi:hypothetical protein
MAIVPFSAFYETATGKLVSLGSVVDDDDATLLSRGITRMEVPAGDMDVKGVRRDRQWNEGTKSFDVIVLPRQISTAAFWDRFTVAEQEEIDERSRTGGAVVQKRLGAFLQRLSIQKVVDLNDPRLSTAVNGLETIGAIGPGRAAEILA